MRKRAIFEASTFLKNSRVLIGSQMRWTINELGPRFGRERISKRGLIFKQGTLSFPRSCSPLPCPWESSCSRSCCSMLHRSLSLALLPDGLLQGFPRTRFESGPIVFVIYFDARMNLNVNALLLLMVLRAKRFTFAL